MEINRDGWIYRIAYGTLGWCEKPTEVGLCELVRRFFWSLFIAWPCTIVFWGGCGLILLAVGSIIYAFLCFVGFFFAARPAGCMQHRMFDSYEKWPEIRGVRIYPIWFVIGYVVIANFSAILLEIKLYFIQLADYTIYSSIFWKIVGVIACIAIVMIVKGRIENNEACRIFREYLKARKQKFCPIVKVV